MATINIMVTPRYIDVPPLLGIMPERRPSVAMDYMKANFGAGRLVPSPINGMAYRWHPERDRPRMVQVNVGANDETR